MLCINTSTNQPDADPTGLKAGTNIVSQEDIFPREYNNPFNLQTLPPPSIPGNPNKPNENKATMYLGSFQIIAMPMTGGLPPGFPTMTTFGNNNPNMFGNKN